MTLRIIIEGHRAAGKTTLAAVLDRILAHTRYAVMDVTDGNYSKWALDNYNVVAETVDIAALAPRDVQIVVRDTSESREFDAYVRATNRTQAPGQDPADMMLNAVLGLVGEAGEVADLMKKRLFHGHTLPEEKLRKELGDILWYLAQACRANGWSLADIAQENLDKLDRRYPGGFSTARSIHRDEPAASEGR